MLPRIFDALLASPTYLSQHGACAHAQALAHVHHGVGQHTRFFHRLHERCVADLDIEHKRRETLRSSVAVRENDTRWYRATTREKRFCLTSAAFFDMMLATMRGTDATVDVTSRIA